MTNREARVPVHRRMNRALRHAVIAALPLALLLAGAGPAEMPDAPVSFVRVDELKKLVDQGAKVDLIDVRRREAYVQQHIKGARSIPLDTFPDGALGIKKTGLVVFY
jgi:hypothetical protein